VVDNSTLTKRAKELEHDLSPKVGCYLRVGWLKDKDDGVVFMVYVDMRARVPSKVFPNTWYGHPVATQDILPPGVSPSKDSPFPNWVF
jgi:hypothetical protein